MDRHPGGLHQLDMSLSDVIVVSNLTFKPQLIYIIKNLKLPVGNMVIIFEKLQTFLNISLCLYFFFSLNFSLTLCLFLVLVY